MTVEIIFFLAGMNICMNIYKYICIHINIPTHIYLFIYYLLIIQTKLTIEGNAQKHTSKTT